MNINQLWNNGLEKLVEEYERAGLAWVDAKFQADQLEEAQRSFLSDIKNGLDNGGTSEAKLDRLAHGTQKYQEYVASVCAARADMLRKKVHFDAVDKLFEAKRSDFAMEREKVAKGIFHTGRR